MLEAREHRERFFGESRAIPPIADNESEEKREKGEKCTSCCRIVYEFALRAWLGE